MSRRTKLIITALFLVLLAIPVWHLIRTWHPENPLRFRHVGEILKTDAFGDDHHSITMELRNNSDVTVIFLVANFVETEPSTEDALLATAHLGERSLDTCTIPPRGTVEVDFFVRSDLSPDAITSLKAGAWQPRKGNVQYGWLSRPKMHVANLFTWVSKKVPVSWMEALPTLFPFVDNTDVEPAPQSQTPVPSAANPP